MRQVKGGRGLCGNRINNVKATKFSFHTTAEQASYVVCTDPSIPHEFVAGWDGMVTADPDRDEGF
jgi:hypothetical protein